ncbi:putative ribonuclease H-like domain-containing protein [Tanacetum coccineum]
MLVQVYVDDIIFGSTNKSWCADFEALMQSMGELTFFLGLQVKQHKDGIFISQDKYVADMLKKFDLVNVKAAISSYGDQFAFDKGSEAFDMCLFTFQVTPKTSRSNAVKRSQYLKGKPTWDYCILGISPLDLKRFSDSDYGGSTLESGIHKQHIVAKRSTTEAEYVAAAHCCGQVLWVQNQLLDYGFNFMNTKIHIDNESTICIVKNPVYHSKTKHIEIRHHFIRDCYEKKLISVEKIHTDLNVADLLTKPFDGPRFNYLVVSIVRLEQRSAIIRNKPPIISQLRNQMITYLKHVANKKHAELKSKSFEEIQVLYERYKKQDQTFVAIGSEEDERAIKKMNEKDADTRVKD